MPYIHPVRRGKIDQGVEAALDGIQAPGDLNYAITRLMLGYARHSGGQIGRGGFSYAKFNELLGVLACVTQEFYRRMVAPYEDTARDRNGDVFDAPLPSYVGDNEGRQ